MAKSTRKSARKPSRKNKPIGKLLEQLKAAGAKVRQPDGSAITSRVISDLSVKPTDFTAWISWSKSF
jgi:hypothetical protein